MKIYMDILHQLREVTGILFRIFTIYHLAIPFDESCFV